jgi:hypothetical protein
MAGLWDSLMKRLVRRYARQFVRWLSAEAVFVRALDIELQNQQLFADALLEVMLHGTSALLHIEFQTYDDADMEVRLQEYNVLASRQYEHLPVYSYVIYLRKVGEVAVSPLVRGFPDGEEVHRFFFRVIELWEVAAEVLLQAGWPAVNPALPAYVVKYDSQLKSMGYTAEAMAAEYTQAIRITPTRFLNISG